MNAVPTITEFSPEPIRWQHRALYEIKKEYDYSLGVHEVLLSGSVGSAKSLFAAHLIITHCLENPGACVLIGRRTMPALRDTLYQMIKDHLGIDVSYGANDTRAQIFFGNGSKIISNSWADKNYKKVRSYALSMAVIEELTETEKKDFYDEIYMRVGRIPGIKENLIICITNPGDPSYWGYEHFILNESKNRHVYYSLTTDNTFLPPSYVDQIMSVLDAKQIRRMIYGEWIYIGTETVYYEYNREKHFVLENTKPIPGLPLKLCFDFNIGTGKPMSSLLMQQQKDQFIVIDEVVLEGTRTLDAMEEWASRGYFDLPTNATIHIHGDCNGRNRDTRQKTTDFDIIQSYLENYKRKDGRKLEVKLDVPKQNPLVRDRHNLVNGKLCNAKGETFIKIDKRCKTIDSGLSKVKIKPGSNYLELEEWHQHVTTALGYGLAASCKNIKIGVSHYA